MTERFEKTLIGHCAATLAGHKCGSLFSYHLAAGETMEENVNPVNVHLSDKGVRVRLLRGCARGGLLYVYRPRKLARRLEDPAVRDFLSAQGWRILADVSEKTIRQFGCADLTALAKRLHLWGLRLDYGFSLEEMCALAQQLPVAVNASTTTPEVARQLAAGGGTVIAMHNFYPRPETGLDPEFLRESTAALQAEGLQVYGFIPGDALLRGPLYAGLPTLEAHRTAAPSAAFADLALNYGLDGIFAGDPEVSAREQEYIRHFCTTGELCLPVALRPGYETLYDRTFTCRPDSPKGLVRYQESRLYSCFGSTVQPDNCVERRRRCVTMDNIGYGRYSGEIQLMRADLPADETVNVIGEVPAEYDLLLDCIKRGKTFRMVKVS